jgi:hypothetical protein
MIDQEHNQLLFLSKSKTKEYSKNVSFEKSKFLHILNNMIGEYK